MIDPLSQNPLNKFQSYQVKHVIVGFRFGEDACTFNITGNIGKCGTIVGGTPNDRNVAETRCKGPGIVFLNELEDPTFVLHEAQTEWNFFSPENPITSSYTGILHIKDRVGMLFAEKVREWQQTLGMGLGHITFAWKTFFVGTLKNGVTDIVTTNPMIFHVTSQTQSLSSVLARSYMMTIVSSYNTFASLPQFSKMFQINLTHADGNTQKQVSQGTANDVGIVSRREENKNKLEARKQRIDKNKPMKNLGDIFNSFQSALTEQGYPSKVQVQEWQAAIRQDYTRKWSPPEQYLPELPIKYTFKLDDRYQNAKVDNRNLPFEQPEQDQRLEGIRVIPFQSGTTIPQAINEIMIMSKSVGDDIVADKPTGYRVTSTTLRGCGGQYSITTNMNPYIIPRNISPEVDTGPGDYTIGGPLTYVFQDSEGKGSDIRALSLQADVTPLQKPMEKPTEGADDIGVVYGNRELVTIQRSPNGSNDFFAASYTGNKGTISANRINGLENSANASIIKSHLTPGMIKQTTRYIMTMKGNPYLVNDLNRNPIDVIDGNGEKNGKAIWNYILYDVPEINPMYLHLTIYMRPEKKLGGEGSTPSDNAYFYRGHLHLCTIKTKYGGNDGFSQIYEAVRTGDGI
jgi:hypothetical protein